MSVQSSNGVIQHSSEEIFDEKKIMNSLKDEDFYDNPDLTEEIEKEVRYNVQSKEPVFEDFSRHVILVDNIPIIPEDKITELEKELLAISAKSGINIRECKILVSDQKTKGFCLFLSDLYEESLKIKETFNGYRFRQNYVLRSFTLEERHKILNPPQSSSNQDEKVSKFQELPGIDIFWNQSDTLAVSDELGNVSIYSIHPFTLKFTFEKFSPLKIHWSTRGSYLVGYNERGIMLMTASTSDKISRKFQHPGVLNCGFSPCERYMITYSHFQTDNAPKMSVFIWDVAFHLRPIKTFSGPVRPFSIFVWSYDGEYLSYIIEDRLFVFKMSTLALAQGFPLKTSNIQSVVWSPTKYSMIFWEKSIIESPSQIVLFDLLNLERRVIRQTFNLEKCTVYWNKNGTVIAVAQTRLVKKTSYHLLEFINLGNREASVDTITLNSPVIDFSWEPYGQYWVAIGSPIITIGTFANSVPLPIKTLTTNAFHCAYWSPIGRFLLIASTKSEVVFETWYCDNKGVSLLGRGDHREATYLSWSPMGRFFLSSAYGPNSSNSKVMIWSCGGYLVASKTIQNIAYCLWRPRSLEHLSVEEIKNIWENIEKSIFSLGEEIKALPYNQKQIDESGDERQLFIPNRNDQFELLKQISIFMQRYYDLKILKLSPLHTKTFSV